MSSRKLATTAFWRGRLPHWEVEEGRYFVTLHLRGAIPEQGAKQIHALAMDLERLVKTDTQGRWRLKRRIFAALEGWLDHAEHVRHFSPEVARMVVEAIRHREGRQWRMFEYTLMPSHLHLFFEVTSTRRDEHTASHLKPVLEQFKRWTAHEAAKLLNFDGRGFWQDEWFDHWSRSDEEDDRIIAYIRRNPVKAGLVQDFRDWPYGGWNK